MPAEAAVDVAVQPPAWLCDDARGYWADLLRHLNTAAIKPADAHAFAILCNALATYAEADRIVQAEGVMVMRGGERGAFMMANPALDVRNSAEASVAKWSTYLHITPEDRENHRRSGEQNRLRHRHERQL